MSVWRALRTAWTALFQHSRSESELEEELRLHIADRADDLERFGLTRAEAERRARLEFGGYEKFKEECREATGTHFFEILAQDIRFGLRMLRKSPGFTAIALTTIALGVAANVSVFDFADALFLRNVAAKDASRLVRIDAPRKDGGDFFSYPEYAYLKDHTKTLESVAAHYSTAPLYVTANGETGEIQGAVVSANYFTMLGVQPFLGRFFTADEDSVPDRDAVAILGYGLWQRISGGDPKIVGKLLKINGRECEVVGIAPPDFQGVEPGGTPNEIWIPSMMIRTGYRYCDAFDPGCTMFRLMARVAPGKSDPEAQAEIGTLMQQLRQYSAAFDEHLGVSVKPAKGISGDRSYFVLLSQLLAAIAGLLLVVVCANVGGVMIARGASRKAEMAIRLTLGAGRGRLVRQLLTESLILALTGGAFGVLLSMWSSRFLADFYSVDDEGYAHLLNVGLNGRVLGYSIGIALVAGLLFGLLPAWQTSGTDLNQALKTSGSARAAARSKTRTALVTMQLALSLALLVGAGLLVMSGRTLEARSNLDVRHVVGLRLRPELLHYRAQQARAFDAEVAQRLGEVPGVESVSLAKAQGLVWHANIPAAMKLPGEKYAPNTSELIVRDKPIGPNYFATLRIPFIAGRDFADADRAGSPAVVIVNETLARRISQSALPLGQTVILDDKAYQIVGVVTDAEIRSAIDPPVAVAYRAFWQDDSLLDARLCVRVSGDPAAAIPSLRAAIAHVNPNIPVTETMPLSDQVRGAYTDTRVAGAVLSTAAALTLVLSAVGLYGVIAYDVNQRQREIGIRMALGAQRIEVVRLLVRQGLFATSIGVASGTALALITCRLLSTWLFGVQPYDASVFLAAATVLFVTAVAASYIPARRAMRVDPMVALRYE